LDQWYVVGVDSWAFELLQESHRFVVYYGVDAVLDDKTFGQTAQCFLSPLKAGCAVSGERSAIKIAVQISVWKQMREIVVDARDQFRFGWARVQDSIATAFVDDFVSAYASVTASKR